MSGRSSIDYTPEMALAEALSDLRSEKDDYNKVLIIKLRGGDGRFCISCANAGLNASEAIAALEVCKLIMMNEMGYVAFKSDLGEEEEQE